MRGRRLVLKKGSMLLAAVALTVLVAPALSSAEINAPETIVYDFLSRSIGKSKGVAVLKPLAVTDEIRTNPAYAPFFEATDYDFLIKVRGGPENAPTLALVMRNTMKQCEPIDPVAEPFVSTQPCTPYPGTERVLIVAVNLDENPAAPFVVTDTEPNKALATLKQRLNMLFNKNPLWVRAQIQETSKTDPANPIVNNRFVGLYYLFQRTLVQVLTNDPREWAARPSFLPQDLFGLFLKDVIETPSTQGSQPWDGFIPVFRSTSRQ